MNTDLLLKYRYSCQILMNLRKRLTNLKVLNINREGIKQNDIHNEANSRFLQYCDSYNKILNIL